MTKMKYILLFLATILIHSLFSSVKAETTFFDQDDAFIMGDSSTTESGTTGSKETGGTTNGDTTTGSTTSAFGCTYEWNCTNWSACLSSGNQTRNCTNSGTCSDTYNTPQREQNCSSNTPEVGDENGRTELEKETGNQSDEKQPTDFSKGLIFSIVLGSIFYIIFKCVRRKKKRRKLYLHEVNKRN